MNPVRLFALSLAALLVALRGAAACPKAVTKAEYQAQLEKSGQAVTIAGQQLGKVITIAEFNGSVSDLQKALRDGEENLKGLLPPANARAANEQSGPGFRRSCRRARSRRPAEARA